MRGSCNTANLRKPESEFSAAVLADLLFGELGLPDAPVLRLAYSGGLDSSVLLHALAELRGSRRFMLAAIHVDHGLHPDSDKWARHCAEVCRQLDAPFTLQRVSVTGRDEEGLEAAARRARYAALRQGLAPGEFLLTAHQRDDQAETLLLQLLRGSGIAGQAAMPARARFGAGELLRPLLNFPRASLMAYAERQRLVWIEDPSNGDTRLRRNFLRAEILPRLAGHWPDAAAALARSAMHAAEALELLDELAEADLALCLDGDQRYPWALSVTALTGLTPAHQRNLLRLWLRRQGFVAPTTRHLNELLARVRHTPQSRQSCVSWPGVGIWRYRDRLVALPARALPDPLLEANWNLAQPFEIPGVGRLLARPSTTREVPRLRALGSVHVRLRQGGETLLLPGRHHHHALKKLIQAAGIPPWERHRLPLFYAGDRLAAVADRWVCAGFAATDDEPGLQIVWEPFELTCASREFR